MAPKIKFKTEQKIEILNGQLKASSERAGESADIALRKITESLSYRSLFEATNDPTPNLIAMMTSAKTVKRIEREMDRLRV